MNSHNRSNIQFLKAHFSKTCFNSLVSLSFPHDTKGRGLGHQGARMLYDLSPQSASLFAVRLEKLEDSVHREMLCMDPVRSDRTLFGEWHQ